MDFKVTSFQGHSGLLYRVEPITAKAIKYFEPSGTLAFIGANFINSYIKDLETDGYTVKRELGEDENKTGVIA